MTHFQYLVVKVKVAQLISILRQVDPNLDVKFCHSHFEQMNPTSIGAVLGNPGFLSIHPHIEKNDWVYLPDLKNCGQVLGYTHNSTKFKVKVYKPSDGTCFFDFTRLPVLNFWDYEIE